VAQEIRATLVENARAECQMAPAAKLVGPQLPAPVAATNGAAPAV
jgi:hypothetical protein